MTETTDTDKILAAAERFGDKLADIAGQYGPDVADVALAAARVDAASQVIGAVGAAIGACISYRFLRTSIVAFTTNDNHMGKELLGLLGTIFSGAALAVFGIAVVAMGASLWPWIGLFEPKIYVAGKLLGWM